MIENRVWNLNLLNPREKDDMRLTLGLRGFKKVLCLLLLLFFCKKNLNVIYSFPLSKKWLLLAANKHIILIVFLVKALFYY